MEHSGSEASALRSEATNPSVIRSALVSAVVGSDHGSVEPARPVWGPVEVQVAQEQAELVTDELFELGAAAVSEQPGAAGTVILVADVDPAAVAAAGWTHRVVAQDPAWATSWHDSARAWRCGERLVVRPVWVEAPAPTPGDATADVVEVVLDPGPAFGSGSHESTRLCLELLEPLASGAGRVLDVGCGTGVLGVAALLLGAGTLVAIDIDADALEATRRAATLNGVAERTTVQDRPLGAVPGEFDLVLANLLVPIIEELGPDLVACLAPDGTLVVGGLLEDQVDRAVVALSPLQVRSRVASSGWVALTLTGNGTVNVV